MRKTLQPPPASAGIAWPSVLWIAGLHVGALAALVPACFTWPAVAVGLGLYWLTAGLGICLTYHRLLTHRSFATAAQVARIRLHGHRLLCLGGRRDRLGRRPPPASRPRRRRAGRPQPRPRPRLGPHALVDDARRHPHPHPGILLEVGPRPRPRPGPPLARPVPLRLPAALCSSALYAAGGLPWLVWGGFVRSCPGAALDLAGQLGHPRLGLPHAIATRDTSTNLWWVALLTFGEGWHNNHHASQTSARHGLRWWELDVTYWAIRLMAFVGLAHGVKRPRMIPAPLPRGLPPEGEAELVGECR